MDDCLKDVLSLSGFEEFLPKENDSCVKKMNAWWIFKKEKKKTLWKCKFTGIYCIISGNAKFFMLNGQISYNYVMKVYLWNIGMFLLKTKSINLRENPIWGEVCVEYLLPSIACNFTWIFFFQFRFI